MDRIRWAGGICAMIALALCPRAAGAQSAPQVSVIADAVPGWWQRDAHAWHRTDMANPALHWRRIDRYRWTLADDEPAATRRAGG